MVKADIATGVRFDAANGKWLAYAHDTFNRIVFAQLFDDSDDAYRWTRDVIDGNFSVLGRRCPTFSNVPAPPYLDYSANTVDSAAPKTDAGPAAQASGA